MQVTLKQSEITAAIARYLSEVLGVSGVSPETLAVVYKQGRSDKNGMTAELEIDAPAYERPKQFVPECAVAPELVAGSQTTSTTASASAVELGNDQSGETAGPGATTSVLSAQLHEPAPVVAVVDAELLPEVPAYEGERRAEPREELAPVAEANDEVAQALAEDAAAEAVEELTAAVEEAPTAPAGEALFG